MLEHRCESAIGPAGWNESMSELKAKSTSAKTITSRMGYACLAFVTALFCSQSAIAWDEYMYADLGIAKEFPGPPDVEEGTYRTEVAGSGTVPARIFSLEQDHVVYRMIVADMRAPEYMARSASILSECIYRAEQEGEVRAKMPQRVEDGTGYRVYGHLTSVDLFENGGRKQTNCFFTKGRLFKIEATVLPEHGQPNSSLAIRFTLSLRFRIDGTTYVPPPNGE